MNIIFNRKKSDEISDEKELVPKRTDSWNELFL